MSRTNTEPKIAPCRFDLRSHLAATHKNLVAKTTRSVLLCCPPRLPPYLSGSEQHGIYFRDTRSACCQHKRHLRWLFVRRNTSAATAEQTRNGRILFRYTRLVTASCSTGCSRIRRRFVRRLWISGCCWVICIHSASACSVFRRPLLIWSQTGHYHSAPGCRLDVHLWFQHRWPVWQQ